MGVQIPVRVSAFSSFGYLPRSGIAGSYGNSAFIFWGVALLFSTAAIPYYICTSNAQGFQFLHILASTYFLVSWWWPFWWVWSGCLLWSHLFLTAPLSGVLVLSFDIERKPVGWQRRESSPLLLIPFRSSLLNPTGVQGPIMLLRRLAWPSTSDCVDHSFDPLLNATPSYYPASLCTPWWQQLSPGPLFCGLGTVLPWAGVL